MKEPQEIIQYIEKKAFSIKKNTLFLYAFAFVYLRQILETAFGENLRIGTQMMFWESVRLLILDYPIFYFNTFLIAALLLATFGSEGREKYLKIVLFCTPWVLLPPLWDFIIHGGGFKYFYQLKTEEVLKNLLSGPWIQHGLGFTQGQFIEVFGASIAGSIYLFFKNRKIWSIFFLPAFFLGIVLLGSPYYLSLFFFKTMVFGDIGFLYYNVDKTLLYNVIFLILFSQFFTKMPELKLSVGFNMFSIFLLFGYLTAWQKTGFYSITFFDILALPILIFLLFLKRNPLFSWLISIIIALALGQVPFILLTACFLFEKLPLQRGFKDSLLSLLAFYAGAGFFLKTRVHLAYPFYYPLIISLAFGIFTTFWFRYRWIPLLALPLGLLLRGTTLFEPPYTSLYYEYEEKYEHTKNPAYLYDLWSLAMASGDINRVEEITNLLTFEYSPADYYGKRADFYLFKGKLKEAEEAALQSIPLGNPFAFLTLGHLYHLQKKSEALVYLRKAHSLKLNPEASFFLLIQEYLRKGDTLSAYKTLQEMKSWNRDSPLYRELNKRLQNLQQNS